MDLKYCLCKKGDMKMDKELEQEVFETEKLSNQVDQKKYDIKKRLGLESWDKVLTETMKSKLSSAGIL